jgi:hypothetical protein
MTDDIKFGIVSDHLEFLIPKEAETMLLPEFKSDPFDDPEGFKADLDRNEWFWRKLLNEHPAAVQYSAGRTVTILSQCAGSYRFSVFDKRGPLSHHDVSSLDDLLRETAGWSDEIAVLY